MATTRVKVLQSWSGGFYGSREKGERFDYDLDKDDADLKKLGFVEAVGDESKPAADKK